MGISRQEYLYDMMYWEILLITRGYRQRHILQYQLQRLTVWASMFCMGNPQHKEPQEIVPLYFDKEEEDEIPDDDEVARIRQEIVEENERINKSDKI